MHVLVLVKCVVDHNVKVRVPADGSGVDTTGLKMSMNPFDVAGIEAGRRFARPLYAGSVLAQMQIQMQIHAKRCLMTLRPSGFAPASGTQTACPVAAAGLPAAR